MTNDQVQLLSERLLDQLKTDSRSSSEIARLAKVSQPTVSRMRTSSGIRQRSSKPFSKLCSFYNLLAAREYNELLKEAIIDAWDGTEAGGQALLAVIKGLQALNRNSDGTTEDSFDQAR